MRAAILAGVLVLGSVDTKAATQQDAEAALTAAQQRAGEASKYNRWIPTTDALKAAKAALEAKDFDKAVAESERAQALAARSIEQSHEEEGLWKDAVIR